MTTMDIEIGLTDEITEIRDTAHKFAEQVVRPTGVELDRLVDPADVIAKKSPLWRCYEQYHELGFGALPYDEEMEPKTKALIG